MVNIHASRCCCWEWSKVMAVKIQALTGGDDGCSGRCLDYLRKEKKN